MTYKPIPTKRIGNQDFVKSSDITLKDLLIQILAETKKSNLYNSIALNEKITDDDIQE